MKQKAIKILKTMLVAALLIAAMQFAFAQATAETAETNVSNPYEISAESVYAEQPEEDAGAGMSAPGGAVPETNPANSAGQPEAQTSQAQPAAPSAEIQAEPAPEAQTSQAQPEAVPTGIPAVPPVTGPENNAGQTETLANQEPPAGFGQTDAAAETQATGNDAAQAATGGSEQANAMVFTVVFVDWNDAALSRTEVPADGKVKRPGSNPGREGSRFEHWYLAGGNETQAYDFDTKITGDISLKAYYTAIPEEPYAGAEAEAMPEKENNVSVGEPAKEMETAVRSVRISSDANGTIRFGDTIVLSGILEGYGDADYTLQWQINTGNGWNDIAGANDIHYRVEVDGRINESAFRLAVAISEQS